MAVDWPGYISNRCLGEAMLNGWLGDQIFLFLPVFFCFFFDLPLCKMLYFLLSLWLFLSLS